MKTKPYDLFQSKDMLWRAKFSPQIAKELGPAAAFIIAAPSKKTANTIAGILVSHAVMKLKA